MNIPGTLPEALALLNACLNATSATLVLLAVKAVRAKDVALHKRRMLMAIGTSAAFLVSYLTRIALAGDTKFQGTGWVRPVYFAMLLSHVVLAVVVLPLILRSVYLGLEGRAADHRRWVRWTFPIWLYVSVTGVLVYLVLYQVRWG